MKGVYLLTGRPGTGKTSLIKAAVADFKGRTGGFYTEELRSEAGERYGFRLMTLDGGSGVLAHVKNKSRERVGKYGVDVRVLDDIGVTAIFEAIASCDVIVIDEIGRMELFSVRFKEAVVKAIESDKKVLGTVMLNHNPFADMIKRRPEVELIPVMRTNNEQVLEEIKTWLGK
jgi:nucleoside-triphosphatase